MRKGGKEGGRERERERERGGGERERERERERSGGEREVIDEKGGMARRGKAESSDLLVLLCLHASPFVKSWMPYTNKQFPAGSGTVQFYQM